MKGKSIGLWIILIGLLMGIGYTAYSIFDDNTFSVKFDENGGSKVTSLKVQEDEKIEKLPVSVREGYKFLGWYLNGELFDLNRGVNQDITLTAVWAEDSSKMCKVYFDTLEGEEIDDVEIPCGEVLKLPEEPIKDGYSFVGWYYQNKVFDDAMVVNQDMILVAKWKSTEE